MTTPMQLAGATYLLVSRERHMPTSAISLALGCSDQEASAALEILRSCRLIDYSRDTIGSVRATCPRLALGRLLLIALDDQLVPAQFNKIIGPESIRDVLELSDLLSVTKHLPNSVDSFMRLAESTVTMAHQEVTMLHSRPLVGSYQGIRTAVEYANLKGLPVTSIWQRSFVSASESEGIQHWLRQQEVNMAVHPEVPMRGVVIDQGRLGVLYDDLTGTSVRTGITAISRTATRQRKISRRLRVLRGMVKGSSDHELADSLHVSIKTIRRDIGRIRELLYADSREQLVARARTLNLV